MSLSGLTATTLRDRIASREISARLFSFAARRSFDISPGMLDALKRLAFDIDYDDGFIAYLNGTEIARARTGSSGEELAHHDIAAGTREVPSSVRMGPLGRPGSGTHVPVGHGHSYQRRQVRARDTLFPIWSL